MKFLFSVRPIINREKLQKVTVRAGALVKFDVDVKGEPPPTITWHFANKQLENEPTVKIENEDYNTKIQLSETTRKNTGIYTVKAENSSGSDEATVEVIILGKQHVSVIDSCGGVGSVKVISYGDMQ
jgi:hypothetical protein